MANSHAIVKTVEVLVYGLLFDMVCLQPSAQDLAKEQKVNYGDDIACVIRVARKRRFNVAEEKRISQEIELQVRSYFLSHCNMYAVQSQ